MKYSQALLIALLAPSALLWAQTSVAQTSGSNTNPKKATTVQPQNNGAGDTSYFGQTGYDAMGGIPQHRAEPTNSSHIGVLGEKWETDKRGRRSSFIHNGVEMSNGRNPTSDEIEKRTSTTSQDRCAAKKGLSRN